MQHAKLPPSSAARRVACPGSRAFEDRYPETEDSPFSREGHAAHWVLSNRLNQENIGKLAPNGERVTEEMIEGAELCYQSVSEVSARLGFPKVHIEQRVNIYSINEECWGTPDVFLGTSNELHIWDYKYGHGYVEVFENWQLLEYASGVLDLIPSETVTLYIVQPRCYDRRGRVRSWTITRDELEPYFDFLRAREMLAAMDEALCKPSPECGHCRARHACPALQLSSSHTLDIVAGNISLDLTNHETGNELHYLKRAAKVLEARITGLEEQAKAMISRGEYVPGFKLESTSSREKWVKDVEELMVLGDLMGIDLGKPREIITPAQARKAGLDDALVKQYSKVYSGALKLVETENARKIFGAKQWSK